MEGALFLSGFFCETGKFAKKTARLVAGRRILTRKRVKSD
jgi:hypothetical protein